MRIVHSVEAVNSSLVKFSTNLHVGNTTYLSTDHIRAEVYDCASIGWSDEYARFEVVLLNKEFIKHLFEAQVKEVMMLLGESIIKTPIDDFKWGKTNDRPSTATCN